MNDYVRAGIIVGVIVLLFVFSWYATDHLEEARVVADNEAVIVLTAENDSLLIVISTLIDSTLIDSTSTDSTGVSNE
jgi:hypothetical protein